MARGRTLLTFRLVEGKLCKTTGIHYHVLRAVLASSPNSCPLECLFIIFNSTFDDGMGEWVSK
jgi:hypothetical protein